MLQTNCNFYEVFRWLVLMVFAVAPATVLAQDTVSEMEAVEVRARSIEGQVSAELSRYGHQVEVVTEKDIKRGGYQDVGQILKGEVSGLYVGQRAGIAHYTNFSLQGSGDGDVLVLLDGVRVNNRLYGSAYLDAINPHMIKRIEVLKGGQSLFYGTEAIKGAINIILKKPHKQKTGEFGVGGGSFAQREVFGDVANSLDEDGDHQYLIFGNSLSSEGFQPYPDEDYDTPVIRTVGRQKRGFDRENIGFKYRYRLEPGESIKLFSTYNRARLPHSEINRDIDEENDRTEIISTLKYENRVSEELSFFVKSYYHDWYTEWSSLEANDTGNIEDSYDFHNDVWEFEDYGVNAMAKYRGSGWNNWVAGVDYQQYWGQDFVLQIDRRTESVWAPYLQWRPRLAFSPNTNLAIGGRYTVPSGEGDKGIWNVSLKHFFTDSFYVRGVTGTSYRLPSAYQLSANEPTFAIGNPDLEPEESLNVNVGLGGNARVARMPLTWDVGYFYTEVDNLISTDMSNVFQNADEKTLIDGYQAKFNVSPVRSVRTKFSYTITDAHSEGSQRQLEKSPESIAKAKLSWTSASGRYGADFISQYVGDLFEREDIDGDGTNETLNYGEYYLLDLGLQYHAGERKNSTFSIRVDNLLDEEYYTYVSDGNYVGGTNPDHFIRSRGTPRSVQLRYKHTF